MIEVGQARLRLAEWISKKSFSYQLSAKGPRERPLSRLEHFQAKWTPVRRPEMRQNKEIAARQNKNTEIGDSRLRRAARILIF
jgi:hypothetical protein